MSSKKGISPSLNANALRKKPLRLKGKLKKTLSGRRETATCENFKRSNWNVANKLSGPSLKSANENNASGLSNLRSKLLRLARKANVSKTQ